MQKLLIYWNKNLSHRRYIDCIIKTLMLIGNFCPLHFDSNLCLWSKGLIVYYHCSYWQNYETEKVNLIVISSKRYVTWSLTEYSAGKPNSAKQKECIIAYAAYAYGFYLQ